MNRKPIDNRMNSMRSRCRGALWLLLLFVGYQWAVYGFSHTHIINGVTIVHSHPFGGQHDHAAGSYIQLAQLSHFLTTTIQEVKLPQLQRPILCLVEVIPSVPLLCEDKAPIPPLRGPPSFGFFF